MSKKAGDLLELKIQESQVRHGIFYQNEFGAPLLFLPMNIMNIAMTTKE